MSPKWVINHSATRFQGRVIRVDSERVSIDSDREIEFDRVVHPGAVVIVPQTKSKEFIMLRQYRHSVREHLIEFPAGTLEANEDPLKCAQRELSEEAGKGAHTWIKLGEIFPAPGFCSEKQFIFLAKDLFEAPGIPDLDESFDIITYSASALNAAILEGKINDSKSLAALTLLQLSQQVS